MRTQFSTLLLPMLLFYVLIFLQFGLRFLERGDARRRGLDEANSRFWLSGLLPRPSHMVLVTLASFCRKTCGNWRERVSAGRRRASLY